MGTATAALRTIMVMTTTDTTITDPGPDTAQPADDATSNLLQLLWLASPALPVGGFSYSEGLEAAVDAGLVSDEASAAAWLIDQLHLGLARADLAVVAQAIPAWRANDMDRIQALNAWVLSTRETQEFRLQTEQMGRSLQEWARSLGELGEGVIEQLQTAKLDTPAYPVAMACAAAVGSAPVRDGLVGYAFGWAENMVQAAIKSVPLGQSAGQRMLARLAREIPTAVTHAMALTDDNRQAFTPVLAILSAQHETQYSRLFRS
jgi:urease accessory protein